MKKYARIKNTGEIAQIHTIDFSNEYVEVVDRMEFNDLAIHSIDELEFIDDEPELNDNQKIVLEWLKEDYLSFNGKYGLFFHIENIVSNIEVPEKVNKAYGVLDVKEEAQVLKAFAEWGLDQS